MDAMPHCRAMITAVLAAVAYALAAAWQARRLAAEGRRESMLAVALGICAVVLHAIVHVQAWHDAGGIDLHFFAALSLVGVALAGLTAALSLRRPVGALGVVVYPIAAACLLLFAFGTSPRDRPAPDWQIQLHAGLALLAYATLSLAALIAIMLWLQERALRRRQLATLLHAFPPLTMLEALLFRLIGTGFALLTLALLAGVVFVEDLSAQHLVHKFVLSLLAWAVFAALLFGRLRYGWRGRRAVRLTLVAMVLLGLAFFGSKAVLELVLQRNA
jgi:ABC-type uncharacterized transport system permease subunit